ncbi:MAG: TIGR04219 family outer membrane beta-barrel protein [Helicobacteraceae bacterium]|nr:TIGR04219 family outer membrane beta-barrel protein [Candidatus Sulfurimonas ponti]
MFGATLLADFTRVEMGAGAWKSSPKGFASYTATGLTAYDVSTEKEETNPYVWILIKHPIPVLPNLRLEYADVTTKGIANGAFKEFTAVNANTQLDLTQFDIVPYYNILDNTAWVTLDLGLDIKLIDASFRADGVTGVTGGGSSYTDSALLPIPLIYTRLRLEIPGTDIGLEGDAKFITYSDSTIYDVRVKIDYTLDFVPVIQPAVEIGYRKQKYKIDEDDLDGKLNMEFSGIYAGIMLRF